MEEAEPAASEEQADTSEESPEEAELKEMGPTKEETLEATAKRAGKQEGAKMDFDEYAAKKYVSQQMNVLKHPSLSLIHI